MKLMQSQNRLLEQLPATLMALNETLERLLPAAKGAIDTVASAQRVTSRVEGLVDELELPVREARLVIERLTQALDSPAVDAIPGTLQRLHDEILPIADLLSSTRSKVGKITNARRVAVLRLREGCRKLVSRGPRMAGRRATHVRENTRGDDCNG